MSVQFDWKMEDNEARDSAPDPSPGPAVWRWLMLVLILLLFLGVGGYTLRQRLARSEEALARSVQAILDQQHEAFLGRDGELFFDTFASDPAWRAAQLRPENQDVWREGVRVTNVEQHDAEVWVNGAWTTSYGADYQRILFFEWQNGELRHVGGSADFWGLQRRTRHPWGELILHEADETWRVDFAEFVRSAYAELCPDRACEPFKLVIAGDFAESAAPNQVRMPSPRLVALDRQGRPSDLYWFLLRQRLEALLTAGVVRFAVPSSQVFVHRELAAEYMRRNPGRQVEIVDFDTLSSDPAELLTAVDGAMLTPAKSRLVKYDLVTLAADEALFASGLVRDLTDYVNTDPDFDHGDFYEQVWLGAWWQERMWFVPQNATMYVMYYAKNLYFEAAHPLPAARWTWDEMARDIAALKANSDVRWGVVDKDRAMLFSYAYNLGNACPDAVTVRCNRRLNPQDVATALAWYQQLTAEGYLPDTAGLTAEERQRLAWRLISPSSDQTIAMWVDEPIEYDNHAIQRQAGVAPLPGSDRFDGVTPLWVRGNVISASSTQPLDTWHWLKFLSYQYPERVSRQIPARPSVAKATRYWDLLPPPLANAMRTAFPFTRPILIEEQSYFSPEQITAVLSGALSPAEAAATRRKVSWFRE